MSSHVPQETSRAEVETAGHRMVLDAIPQKIFLKAEDSTYVMVNESYARDFGVTPEEFVGRRDLDFFPRELADKYRADDLRVMQSGVTEDLDEDIIHQGEKKTVHTVKIPLSDPDGRVTGLLGVFWDITDRKRLEEELRQGKAMLSEALEMARVGYWIFDVPNALFTFNDQFYSIYGTTAEREGGYIMTPERYSERFVHPEARGIVQEELTRALTSQDAEYAGRTEHRILKADGREGYIAVLYRTVRDSSGQVVRLVGANQDITQRKEIEDALRESEERWNFALEGSGDGVWDWRLDTGEVFFSKRWKEMLGFEENEIQNSLDEWAKRVHPEDLSWVLDEIQKYFAGEIPFYSTEHRVMCKDGSYKWILDRGKIVSRDSDGKPFRMVGTHTDMSERIQAELALREAKEAADAASQAKSEFLARMSHEIRTPLNAITGLSYLMLQTGLSSKQQDYMRQIGASAHILLSLINDILDFSKIEAGRIELEAGPFSLDDVMANVAGLVGIQAEKKDIEIFFELENDVPLDLRGDPIRLGQVITNLAGNAVKFTNTGEVLVHCGLISRDQMDGGESVLLSFTIRDTGIGISPEQRERLFELFSQGDGSITRRYGGSGLGLAISRRLVELMGGAIWVESELDHGSTFHFTARFQVHKTSGDALPLIPEKLKGTRMLVVDDSSISRDILRSGLESFGFRVETAGSGPEALKAVGENMGQDPFGLILMDWKMPVMDGFETAKQVRATHSRHGPPTIVMVTAHRQEEAARRAREAGLDGFMTKPVSRSALLSTVLEVLGKKRSLKVDRPPAVPGSEPPATSSQGDMGGSARRILLVEDHEINQMVAGELLSGWGYTVILSSNGRDALEKLRHSTCDLVLMDVEMPEMDGYEAARRIRTMPGHASLPIIAMTAHAMTSDREKSLQAGMNGHLSKPIKPLELFHLLEAHLGRPSASQKTRPLATPSPDFPDLPGVDVKSALERTGGNSALYRQLLHRFVRDFSPTAAPLRSLLDLGPEEELLRLLHNLKGSAGNLGMIEVREAAAHMEDILRKAGTSKRVDEERAALTRALEHLEGSIHQVLSSVARLPADAGTPEGEDVAAEEPRKGELLPCPARDKAPLSSGLHETVSPLEAMRKALEAGSLDAAGCMAQVRDYAAIRTEAVLRELEQAVEDLDYERGKVLLAQLAGSFGLG